MSRHRHNDYDDDGHLDYDDFEEESFESDSYSDEESGGVFDDQSNNTPEVADVDVTPLLCKTHDSNFSEDCSHCKALRAVIPKEQMAQFIGPPAPF